MLVAPLGNGDARHIFHYKVGHSRGCRAAVEYRSDYWMIHQCECLTLGIEPSDRFPRSHTRLHKLQGDAAADRIRLFRQPDLAHAALANPLEQTVGTEWFARADRYLRLERTVIFQKTLATFPRWTIEECDIVGDFLS